MNTPRKNSKGEAVPHSLWIPKALKNASKYKSVLILLHYQTGSKSVWFEDQMTPLMEWAEQSQTCLLAYDLYGHGDWKAQEPEFDPNYLPDELCEKAIDHSAKYIAEDFLEQKKDLGFTQVDLMGWSFGTTIALKMIPQSLSPDRLIFAAPTPEKEYDDGYSFHNNLKAFSNSKVLFISGTKDEEVQEGEVPWVFDQIQSQSKKLIQPESGHDLPKEWINWAIEFLRGNPS